MPIDIPKRSQDKPLSTYGSPTGIFRVVKHVDRNGISFSNKYKFELEIGYLRRFLSKKRDSGRKEVKIFPASFCPYAFGRSNNFESFCRVNRALNVVIDAGVNLLANHSGD
jgi:hypothetical protein